MTFMPNAAAEHTADLRSPWITYTRDRVVYIPIRIWMYSLYPLYVTSLYTVYVDLVCN